MITLGLYHGLVFLPVLLSLVGPDAYQHIRNEEEEDENDAENRAEEKIELNVEEEGKERPKDQRKKLFKDDVES